MTVAAERRRKLLIVSFAKRAGDVLPDEFARLITGGPLYFIKSITNGYALAWDTRRPGHYDILPVQLLMRERP